jgi:hypothetical protein
MEKPMSTGDLALFRKSRLLFEFLVFLAGWLALDAALRVLRLGQPTAPRIFQVLLAGMLGGVKRNSRMPMAKNRVTALIN